MAGVSRPDKCIIRRKRHATLNELLKQKINTGVENERIEAQAS